MDLAEKQRIAEEEHKKFVDLMYPLFGLNRHPSYCEIIVESLPVGEIFNYTKKIYIDSDFFRASTTWHESGHFLHWRKRGHLPERNGQKNRSLEDPRYYNECIADLGGLIFLDLTKGLTNENAEIYFHEENNWPFEDIEMALINIARTNKGLLRSFVTNKDIRRSMRIIYSYRQSNI